MLWLDISLSLLENFLVLSFLGLFFKERSQLIKYAYTILLMMVSSQLDTLNNPFLMLIAIAFLILYCVINIEEKVSNTIFYIIFMFIILYFIGMGSLLIEGNYVDDLGYQLYENQLLYLFFLIAGKLILLGVYILFKRHKSMLLNLLIVQKQMVIFSISEIILFMLIVMFLSVFMHQDISFTISLFVFFCLMMIFIIFTYQVIILARVNKSILDERIKRVSLEYEKAFYHDVKDLYEKNRSVYHDMKNHMNVLQHMLKNQKQEDALQYLDTISSSIESLDAVHTSRSILNYILNTKLAIMKKQGIVRIMNVNDTLDFMEDVDLCVLLGNLLDNSIEACSDAAQPFIELTIDCVDDFAYIDLENAYVAERLLKDNGQLITSKTDAELHGFGNRNMKKVVEKYQGWLDITEGEQFRVYIAFDKKECINYQEVTINTKN